MVVKYILLTSYLIKLNILSAIEYRTAFLIHVVGMIVNDTSIVLIWYILFLAFPQINGWEFKDMLILFSIAMMQYGILGTFTGGLHSLARTITTGTLDYYLALPKPVLWHILLSKTDMGAIGDLIFGLLLYILFITPSVFGIVAFIGLSILTAAIYLNINILIHSVAFYYTNFEEVVYQYNGIMGSFSFTPSSVFQGTIKWLMLTIFPVIFTVIMPVNLLREWQWSNFLPISAFWLVSGLGSLMIFSAGLKRYESGNLIHTSH